MLLWQALILAVVQGVTEFLPVSSSGHLALLQNIMDIKEGESSLFFSIILHLFSALAVCCFMYRDIIGAFKSNRRIIYAVVIATVPGAMLGVFAEDYVASFAQNGILFGACFLGTGFFLMVGEHLSHTRYSLKDVPVFRFIVIGLAQAAAILPGLSRSGLTISSGLVMGLERGDAARFSFLLSLPIIFGATAKKILFEYDKLKVNFEPITILAAGVVTFVVSLLALSVLLRIVQKRKLVYFAVYCAILGVTVLILAIIGKA
ncbi:MAG: undecaprenyl-diphosphate phosphatase [Planctomycetes bacterium]|nr:undecaprenyl-diphosphate phosphatase [Planctomycetota bacterium]